MKLFLKNSCIPYLFRYDNESARSCTFNLKGTVSHYQFLNAIISRFFLKKLQKFNRESVVSVSYYDSLSDRTEGPSEKSVYFFSHLLGALRSCPHLWSRPSLDFYWRWVLDVFTQGTDVFASYGEAPSYSKLFPTACLLALFFRACLIFSTK